MKPTNTPPPAKPPEVKPPELKPLVPPAEPPKPPAAPELKPLVPPAEPPEPEPKSEATDPTMTLASLLRAYPSDLVTASELNAKLADCREDLEGDQLDSFDRLVVLCAVAGVSTPTQFNAMAEHLGLKVREK